MAATAACRSGAKNTSNTVDPMAAMAWVRSLRLKKGEKASAHVIDGTTLMRVVDAFLSFPSIFLLLALAAFINPSPLMITIIIAITSWMEVARIVEAEVRSMRDRDFIVAARMLGLPRWQIMFREMLPNVIGSIIVAATLTIARAILLEAYVSFLGYGIQPPLPSWGNMLNGAQQYLDKAPWLAIVPGIAITMAV